jgi:hypothetical protein
MTRQLITLLSANIGGRRDTGIRRREDHNIGTLMRYVTIINFISLTPFHQRRRAKSFQKNLSNYLTRASTSLRYILRGIFLPPNRVLEQVRPSKLNENKSICFERDMPLCSLREILKWLNFRPPLLLKKI